MKLNGTHECYHCGKIFNWYYESPSENSMTFRNIEEEIEAQIYLDNPYSAQVLVTCPECKIANKFEHNF
ncbi:hypothetical protein [Parageobacillus sp. G301]|uniref:hypothetical protein n=1 Tax=Parageobacillus sp. G301 TaxID=2998290 RepID=UPI00249676E8|nr:hypothetical protein [Parageobacillus sp. G301]GLH62401.1 hypothetical protein PG301_02410 [Parageobacillus sp. G301]